MSLSDFATLAEAQAFELITDKLQVGSGQARGFFVSEGIWTTLRQIQGDITNPLFALADAVIVTASDASSFFGLDPTTAEGRGNLAAANTMVDAELMKEAQKASLLALALKSTYPHATATQADFDEANDAGETLGLNQNNSQHLITVNITTQPRKPTSLKIQHRFGSSAADVTEWHDCGTIQNAFYTQRSYYTMIPASPSAYRELRLVSPLTLGVSIV
jgi:hypothetical protein